MHDFDKKFKSFLNYNYKQLEELEHRLNEDKTLSVRHLI